MLENIAVVTGVDVWSRVASLLPGVFKFSKKDVNPVKDKTDEL